MTVLADFAAPGGTAHAGLYLHGPAGRGKTWLVDALVAALEPGDITRVHLHAFLAELHPVLFRLRMAGDPDALPHALAAVIGAPALFVLDEFHTHDSGDARLLTLVLTQLRELGSGVIVTSNYPPDALLADSEWAHTMAPAIELITASYAVIEIDDGTDHRDGGSNAGNFSSGTWQHHTTRSSTTQAQLTSAGRSFTVVAIEPVLTLTFEQACLSATAAMDFLAWAEHHRHWRLLDVPALASVSDAAQQRFITLIDVLADSDVRLDVSSVVPWPEFVRRAGSRPDAFRTISRLGLLQREGQRSDS